MISLDPSYHMLTRIADMASHPPLESYPRSSYKLIAAGARPVGRPAGNSRAPLTAPPVVRVASPHGVYRGGRMGPADNGEKPAGSFSFQLPNFGESLTWP
jgi:hypothetical protein